MVRSRPRQFIPLVARLRNLRPDVPDPARAISAGEVLAEGRVVTNPRALVRADASVTWRPPRRLRGALKLRAALDAFGAVVRERVALDVGSAAGGFTLVLLEAGAVHVYAVDVGYGQLVGSLRSDPRVTNLERTNVADLDDRLVPAEVEVVTMDLSYLPVALAAPQLEQVRIHPCADLIALVKPMYELGRRTAPHSRADLGEACRRAADGVEATGWSVDRVDGVIPSPVPGARGAHEFLLHARRRPSP